MGAVSKGSRNRSKAAAQVAAMRAAEARRKRNQRLLIGAGAVLIVAALAVGITLGVSGGGSPASGGGTPHLKLTSLSALGSLKPAPSPGPLGPEGVPIPAAAPLTGTTTKATGQKVDGISCQTSEQTIFHNHAHLTIFVN